MKKLLFASLLMFSISAWAQVEVNTHGLTESQKADLVKVAEGMKQQTQQAAPTEIASADVADKVVKWANVGEQFGKMIGGAAKEVGVAANEFLKTPVGIMTAGLIIFHYVGSPIIHVALGLILFITGMTLVTWLAKRGTQFEITYDKTKTNVFGNYVVLSKQRGKMSEDFILGIAIGYIITVVVSIWTVFAW